MFAWNFMFLDYTQKELKYFFIVAWNSQFPMTQYHHVIILRFNQNIEDINNSVKATMS